MDQSTMSFDLDQYELDASALFKDEAADLSTVQNLEDALSRFGFDVLDKISRRELVLIYKQIKSEMDKEIFHLANVLNRYDDAKEMRQRQISLRQEFDDLQKNAVISKLREQEEALQKAAEMIQQELAKKHSTEVDDLKTMIDTKKQQEEFFHSIQTGNLTQTISKIHPPSLRYSKRLIELHKAETGLNLLNEYDDAMKVRKMIDKIKPGEQRKNNKTFEKTIESQRIKLSSLQASDTAKLEEKLKKFEWQEIRRRESEEKLSEQRLKNHKKDMRHTHAMELKLKPEMSVKPSALWQHREHFTNNSSSLRGHQLLNYTQGNKKGGVVYAEPLTKRHNFLEVPQDTVDFYPSVSPSSPSRRTFYG